MGDYPKNVDPCRAEVFSIGTVILSLGCLKDVHNIYENNKVDEDKLKNHQILFKSRYSPRLYDIVNDMLEVQPERRKKSSELFSRVKYHEEDILDLKPVYQWKI